MGENSWLLQLMEECREWGCGEADRKLCCWKRGWFRECIWQIRKSGSNSGGDEEREDVG